MMSVEVGKYYYWRELKTGRLHYGYVEQILPKTCQAIVYDTQNEKWMIPEEYLMARKDILK